MKINSALCENATANWLVIDQLTGEVMGVYTGVFAAMDFSIMINGSRQSYATMLVNSETDQKIYPMHYVRKSDRLPGCTAD